MSEVTAGRLLAPQEHTLGAPSGPSLLETNLALFLPGIVLLVTGD